MLYLYDVATTVEAPRCFWVNMWSGIILFSYKGAQASYDPQNNDHRKSARQHGIKVFKLYILCNWLIL